MTKKLLPILAVLVCSTAVAVSGQTPRAVVAPVDCLPPNGNAAAVAAVDPDVDGREARLYFRRDGHGDFYYTILESEDPGEYWGVFPVPEEGNRVTEYYVAVVEEGRVLAQSPVQTVPVEEDCPGDLSSEQRRRASDLAIGETSLSQKHRKVAWWECVGITERIDVLGERRDDTSCHPVAWWERPEMLVPVGLAGAGISTIVIVGDEPPPSGGPELSPVIP